MDNIQNNVTSPRIFALGLYIFLTINVILICVFLMRSESPALQVADSRTGVDTVTTKKADAVPPKISQKMRVAEEDKVYKVLFDSAKNYIQQGDSTDDLYVKVTSYDKALDELSQIHKRIKYQKKIGPYVEKLRKELLNTSTLKIKIGDTQDELEQVYGKPGKVVVLEKYFPVGSMKYAYYDKLGVRFALNKGRIYSIKYESNFKVIFRGIKIDDPIHKIKRINPGRIIPLPGGRYGYQELDRKTTYLFVDNDDFIDGIEQFDKAIYGEWDAIIK